MKKTVSKMRSETSFYDLTNVCSNELTYRSERFLSTQAFFSVSLSFYKPCLYQLFKGISIQLFSFEKTLFYRFFFIKMW